MQYELVLQFPVDEEFDFDSIIELETKLTFELGDQHVFKDHTFGATDINIIIATDNPEQAFEKIMDIVSTKLAATLKVAYREMESEEYQWLYLANHEGEFQIK